MPTAAEMEAKINGLSDNIDKLDLIVNGGPTTYVTTGGGVVKSMAMMAAEYEALVVSFEPTLDLKLNISDYTGATILSRLVGVDGAGSTLDADFLDGQQGSFYQNATNLNAGTIADARLPGTMTSKIFSGAITVMVGAAGTPSLNFSTDLTTGIYRSGAGVIGFATAGAAAWLMDANLVSATTTGARISGAAPSATVPNFIPNRSFLGTGIGSAAGDQLSLICNSTEVLRLTATAVTINKDTTIVGTAAATLFSGSGASLTNLPWASLTGKPTTISGYGITDAVTLAGNQTIAGTKTFSGDVIIGGDLTVSGNTITLDVGTVSIEDAIMQVGTGNTGATAPYLGMKAERGTTDAFMVFDESDDYWGAFISTNDLTTPTASGIKGSVLKSTVATGTAPLIVASTTKVTNLNADQLDGLDSTAFVLASTYIASDVLAKLLTVDGAGSGLDADLLDGQHGSYYLSAATYTAADVLAKLLTVDGAGSGLDADLLDGQSSAFYQSASNINAGTLADARLPTTQVGKTWTGINHIFDNTGAVAALNIYLRADVNQDVNLRFQKGTLNRFILQTNGTTETGVGNAGSDFELYSYDDAGSLIGRVFKVTRSSRVLDFNLTPTVAGSTIWHSGNDGTGSGLDADLLDGLNSTAFVLAATYTAADVLAKLLTVDGAGSGLDADLLDGNDSAYYRSASNINAGTLADTYLPGTMSAKTFSGAVSFATGAAATPSINFSADPTTGFWSSASTINIACAGIARFQFTGSAFQSATSTGPRIAGSGATATVPVLIPNRTDLTTGIGGVINTLSLIVQGAEILKLTSSAVTMAMPLTVTGAVAATSFSGDGSALTSLAWANLTGKPTTVAGYGITDAVTLAGNQTIAGTKTFSGDVVIGGDLTVSGNTITLDVGTVSIEDAIMQVGTGNTGATAPYLGIKAERGTTDAFFVFDESDDYWGSFISTNDLTTPTAAGVKASILKSTIATGTAPLVVASTTMVTNLNAELLGGQNGAYYRNASNLNAGNVPVAQLATGTPTGSKFLRDDGTWALPPGGGGAVWGFLTGTLSDQTDLQTALNAKLPSASYTAADVLSKLLTVDGAGSGLDADLLDGQSSAYFLAWANFTGTPTTRAGYGITDAQPLDATLTALAAVNWGSGSQVMVLTAADTFSLRNIGVGSTTDLIDRAGGDARYHPLNGNLAFSALTSKPTTLSGYGITDAQGLDATLTALAGVTTAANKLIYASGVDTFLTTDIVADGRTLIGHTFSQMRTDLGLVIGTNVQAQSAILDRIAALTQATDTIPYFSGASTTATAAFTSVARTLVAQTTQALQRTTGLGLGTAATYDEATAAQIWANTADKVITTDAMWAAQALVTLTPGATVTPNFNTGFNFTLAMGGNYTLANPTNPTVGQSGSIRLTQDGTGSRTLAFGTNWKFAGGVDPILSTAAGTVDILHFKVWSSTFIEASLMKGVA